MPKLKDVDINYEQIRDLVYQLTFEKKMSLIKEIVRDKDYQKNFYNFSEDLKKNTIYPTWMNPNWMPCFMNRVCDQFI